jgi:hypothetical protein
MKDFDRASLSFQIKKLQIEFKERKEHKLPQIILLGYFFSEFRNEFHQELVKSLLKAMKIFY